MITLFFFLLVTERVSLEGHNFIRYSRGCAKAEKEDWGPEGEMRDPSTGQQQVQEEATEVHRQGGSQDKWSPP